MDNIKHLAPLALTILVFAPGVAYAGVAPIELPEPSSLAVLAVGLGVSVFIKFRKRN